MSDKCQYCDMPMNINKFGIAHDFLGRQHGLNSITCVRLQLAQSQQRVKELEGVVDKLKTAWEHANEYGPVDDGSSGSRASQRMLGSFREAAQAARSILEDQG